MVIKIGHRGAMGYAPENTLSSFKKAIELKVDMIELDVHVCRSGELIVIHDHKLERTTNGRGYVVENTGELRKLNAGDEEKIPTLREVLNVIDKKVKVNIELKGQVGIKPVFELIEEFVQTMGWKYDDFLVSSFSENELREFNELSSNIKIGMLIAGDPKGFFGYIRGLDIYSVNINVDFISQEFVDEAHSKNLNVFVWTVNDVSDIKRMKLMGVDGIISDFPDRI